MATGIVLIYLMLHGWVIVFFQWGVADSPALLGWMWDSPPPRCALLPHKLFGCLWKVLVAFPALCHLVLLVVPAGEGSGRSQWEQWAQLAQAGLVHECLKGSGAMSSAR